jgi:hypothetical protein
MVKFCTLKVALPLRGWPAEVPLAVNVYTWPVVAAVVVRVTLKLTGPLVMLTEPGQRLIVGGTPGPEGVTTQLVATVPVKPLIGVIVTVYGPLL